MDKKRKILLIVLAIAVVIGIIVISIPEEKGEHGKKLEMTCLAENVGVSPNTPHVVITLENSMSMKGYVAKESGVVYPRMTFEGVIGDMVTNLNTANFPTQWLCGTKKGRDTKTLFDNGIGNGSIFAGGDTPLEEYIEKVGKQANDSTISIFVSDMVFSMSTGRMRNNPEAIKNEIPKLQSLVKYALEPLKQKQIHILLVQYTSDFNGKYYYNCTNNIKKCAFKNEVLHQRPFYVLVLGTRDNLNSLIGTEILPSGYEKLWASFELNETDFIHQEVTAEVERWLMPDLDPDAQADLLFTFWNEPNTDWEGQTSKITLSFAPIAKRAFLNPEWKPQCGSAVGKAHRKSDTEIEVDIIPYNQLQTIEDITISLISERYDWKACSIEDDFLPLDAVNQLEGKTWAFDKFMDALADVYHTITKPEEVGKIEFKLMKY